MEATFFSATDDPLKDLSKSSATLYSRTPVWIGDLKVPAGLLRLVPSQTSEGWKLTILQLAGEWSQDKLSSRTLGAVPLKATAVDRYPSGEMVLELFPSSRECSTPMWVTRELHMIYKDLDMYVCLRPDQVFPTLDVQASLTH
jgi:hypothetical protein